MRTASVVLLLGLLAAASLAQPAQFRSTGAVEPDSGRPLVVLPTGERCVAGQVIVKLNPSLRGRVTPPGNGPSGFGVEELDSICQREGMTGVVRLVPQPHPGRLVLDSGADLLYLLSFSRAADVGRLMREFQGQAAVDGVWPNAVFDVEMTTTYEVPNDSLYSQQWYLPRIRAPQAWDIAHGDTSVVVGSIASGVAWTHPDIESNLWVNTPEDINRNGRFDPFPAPEGDIDGIDEDGDGRADDVIGYDFYSGDPNPMPDSGDDYGTMCLGAANAATANGIGIAAPPWNVRGAALRCGSGGAIVLSSAIAAIYYCVSKEFWVLAMPWSGRSQYQPLFDACQVAWAAGRVLVASGTGEVCYPACYHGVISIGATDHSDHLLTGSNHISIGSPGADIVVPTADSGYMVVDQLNGAACELAAGVLAWFKSTYPGLTNVLAESLMYEIADTVPGTGCLRIAMVPDTGSAVDERVLLAEQRLPATTVVRGELMIGVVSSQYSAYRAELADINGRRVMELHGGANDVSGLQAGVYFVREYAVVSGQYSGSALVRKIIIAR